MKTYRIEFDRIGRNNSIGPLTCVVPGEAALCLEIRNYVRPNLRSRDFDVMVDMEAGTGFIAAGMRNAGEFTISETSNQ